MNGKQILGMAATAALAIFAGQAAAGLLGAKEGSLTGTLIKIAGGMGGVFLAGKLVKA